MIFDKAFRAREPTKKSLADTAAASMTLTQLVDWLGSGGLSSAEAPMGDATYFICQRVLSESMGKLPLKLVRKTAKGGTEQLTSEPLYDLLRTRPNRYTTAATFQSRAEFDRNEYGNAFVRIEMTPEGLQLWRLPPPQVTIWFDNARILSDTEHLWYKWSAPNGKVFMFSEQEIIHFPGWYSVDGVAGLPVRTVLRLTIDGALSSEKMLSTLYANGMVGKAVLQYTGDLSVENKAIFAAGIQDYIDGNVSGTKNLIPLPFGTQLTPVDAKLADAQYLELRKFTALQVAGAFGVKPDQINDYTKSSYASSEAQELDFLISTLLWRLENNVQELNYKLLTSQQRADGWTFDYNTGVLLKPTTDALIDASQKAVGGGIYTPNEARSFLGLPASEYGDELYFSNGSALPMRLAGTQYDKNGAEGGN